MFWFFENRKIKRVEEETKRSFESVKKDLDVVSGWIKHLDSEKKLHEKNIDEIKEDLSSIKKDLENLKNVFTVMNELRPKQLSKQVFNKQTAVQAVQTGVQTGVQTPKLEKFSITEKAIIWVLLNTDMKLSYDDLASMLGKERSTIRGQINSIKQKSEDLLSEIREKNGKKRVFIDKKTQEEFLKKTKVRVKR